MKILLPRIEPRARVWSAVVGLALSLAAVAHGATNEAKPLFRACASGPDRTSTTIADRNGRTSWTIKLDGTHCAIDFRLEGKVKFNDDFTDVASMSSDAKFRVDVRDDGTRRQLEIESEGGGLVRTWRVDGRDRPYDADARAWLAAFLIEVDRRTAVGVEQRMPSLLRKGGVSAVLEETGRMRSDYARNIYYSKLATTGRLSSGDLARVFDQAASLGTSDYYGAELLKSLGARAGTDPAVRSAMFRMIGSMSSDYYRVESVRQTVGNGRLGGREMDFVIDVVPHVESGYYKTELLKLILAAGNIDAAQRAKLAGFAQAIDEDAYASGFVQALATKDAGPASSRALIDAASTIESDYYLTEAISAILAQPALTEADLLTIVRAVPPSHSDYYRAGILRRVVEHRSATDAVRRAALASTGGMSSHYREEVEKAAGSR